MAKFVFVYGTLKIGESNYPLIEHLVASAEAAIIHAVLYDLGPYPAIIAGENPVYGQLLSFTDLPGALRLLDDVEDYYGPGHPDNEYERLLTTAWTNDGLAHTCFCYFYSDTDKLSGLGTQLPDGHWPR